MRAREPIEKIRLSLSMSYNPGDMIGPGRRLILVPGRGQVAITSNITSNVKDIKCEDVAEGGKAESARI